MEGEASSVLGPAPRLVAAMAQYQQGDPQQALKTLATAVVAFDWSASQADGPDVWVVHVLRREAEALIVPWLTTFIQGNYQPQNNDERISLIGTCTFQGEYGAAAKLFADAIVADPSLTDELARQWQEQITLGDRQPTGRVEELAARCRYPFARCAVLAATDGPTDTASLSPTDQAHLRDQALEWLRADLSHWKQVMAGGSQSAQIVARKTLAHWRCDPHLAAVRDPSELTKLPGPERTAFVALWNDLDALLAHAPEHF
jgi:serine/threonine-protein kinase